MFSCLAGQLAAMSARLSSMCCRKTTEVVTETFPKDSKPNTLE